MNYLIIGGNSDIAKDVIHRLTENGHAIHALVRGQEQAGFVLADRGLYFLHRLDALEPSCSRIPLHRGKLGEQADPCAILPQ